MKSRLPKRFEFATIEHLDTTQFSMVGEYAENLKSNLSSGKGLLLAGRNGVGKSYSLAALTKYYREICTWRPTDYEFVTSPEMIENAPAIGEKEDEFRSQTWLKTYCTVPWLVINDLGKEYRGGKLAEQVPFLLGRILRARNEKCLVTHITTNLPPGDLRSEYGESIVSIMEEMLDMYVVNGPDRRKA